MGFFDSKAGKLKGVVKNRAREKVEESRAPTSPPHVPAAAPSPTTQKPRPLSPPPKLAAKSNPIPTKTQPAELLREISSTTRSDPPHGESGQSRGPSPLRGTHAKQSDHLTRELHRRIEAMQQESQPASASPPFPPKLLAWLIPVIFILLKLIFSHR
jgi:hypothetical protein